MKQLGKNLFLTLGIVAALLVVLGLKRNFDGEGGAVLLSQPTENPQLATRPSASGEASGERRPRVLQAKPVTQHEHAIPSPTTSPYASSEFEPAPKGTAPRLTLPTPIAPTPRQPPVASVRPLEVPELVATDESLTSPATATVGDEVPQLSPLIETSTVPVAARPLPEFVLTDSEDSFWSISERVYGSGTYYRALFRHNEANVLRPDQLRAGVEVRTPPLNVLRELYPADFPQDASLTP